MRSFEKLIRWMLILGIFILLVAPNLYAAQDLESRVEELERRVVDLERMVEELRGSGPPFLGQGPSSPALNTPFFHEVRGAISKNGLHFEVLPGPFFQHASVPDVLELKKDSKAGKEGMLLLYFVDFSEVISPSSEGISLASSINGRVWSEKKKITLMGKLNRGAAVDPSVVELVDGRIRMYFFGSEIVEGDPAMASGNHKIYSAISEDGVHFQVEPGIRFQAPSITDPEVLRAGREWLMFLSEGTETLLARSKDGLNFKLDRTFCLNIGGVPGAVELANGKVRIFACGQGGIVSALFTPGSDSPPVIEHGVCIDEAADPACVRRLNGTYYLIFKTMMKKGKPGSEISGAE